jgi:hypothetical protein
MMKKFMVFTEPNPADPAYVFPVLDITDPDHPVQYSTEAPLMQAAQEVYYQLVRQKIMAEELRRTLEVVGLSMDEYVNLRLGRSRLTGKTTDTDGNVTISIGRV